MKFSKWLFNLLGWKIVNVDSDVPKCVVVLAPHTSNWDFVIGKLAYSSLGRKAHFLIKKEWFFFPFNIFFRSIGGISTNRSEHTSMTDKMAQEFQKRERFQLAITPEGTRKANSEWKKGFYYISLKAEVPILLVGLDYRTKSAMWLDLFKPTGDYDTDIVKIKSYYKDLQGKHPKQFVI